MTSDEKDELLSYYEKSFNAECLTDKERKRKDLLLAKWKARQKEMLAEEISKMSD